MEPHAWTLDSEPQAVESLTVTSADGTGIAVERSGDGPPLVLVHGTAGDHGDWRSVRPTLAEAFTVYAIDRRGRGQSGDADEYALEREFEDVAAVVESIDRPVFLLGHSFGGLCSIEAALRTDNIATLVLYEPLVPVGSGELVSPEVLGQLETLLSEGDREAALVMFLREMVGVSDDEITAIEGGPEWTAGLAAVHTVPRESRGLNGYLFDPSRFENMTTTTILLVGSESPGYLQQFTETVAEALPESQLVTLQGQGHAAMNTDPEGFARTVVELLGMHSLTDGSDHTANTTVADRNERLVREYFQAVWNDGDLELFDTDVVSDDYLMHHQSNVDYSVEGLREAWADWHRAFPDLSNEIEELIATDNRVVIRYRFSGTHEGPVMDVPATGRRVETVGMVIFRIEDGQLVEEWAMDDIFGLLEQLGELGETTPSVL
jgi:steroid delta-isomerase-like uncharacterized protein